MSEPVDARVAVYIDFDNIVISRSAQLDRQGDERTINLSTITAARVKANPALAERLDKARVDIGAVLDFASTFGTIAVSRAYADWSHYVNAQYKDQLMNRAVDLVQLFPAVRGTGADKPAKNGADIRLAVDVVEDLFRLPDISCVVIVAGDSDYIALAQRCKRLGRYVIGVGVAGSTSKFLASACDRFVDYDELPAIKDPQNQDEDAEPTKPSTTAKAPAEATPKGKVTTSGLKKPPAAKKASNATTNKPSTATQQAATRLLRRALQLGESKGDADWIASSEVKNQMLRLDPSFQESALGYKNFTEFVKSRQGEIELKEEGLGRWIRRRATAAPTK